MSEVGVSFDARPIVVAYIEAHLPEARAEARKHSEGIVRAITEGAHREAASRLEQFGAAAHRDIKLSNIFTVMAVLLLLLALMLAPYPVAGSFGIFAILCAFCGGHVRARPLNLDRS